MEKVIIKEEVRRERVRDKQKNGDYSLSFIAKKMGCSRQMLNCWLLPKDNPKHKNFKDKNLLRLNDLLDLLDQLDRF